MVLHSGFTKKIPANQFSCALFSAVFNLFTALSAEFRPALDTSSPIALPLSPRREGQQGFFLLPAAAIHRLHRSI
jgi:hypothetical protein